MAILDDIRAAFPDLTPETRDDGLIAATLSQGRTKVVKTLGGVGTIMETLGPDVGAALLDQMSAMAASNSAVKWAFTLINAGGLDFGSPAVRGMIQALIPDAQIQAALLAVPVVPDVVTPQQVADALAGNI